MRQSLYFLGKAPRVTGLGKGRPAEVAILEPEVRNDFREQSQMVVDHRDFRVGPDQPVTTATRVRRNTLIGLLVADALGLALAGFIGPLVGSKILNRGAGSSHLLHAYLFDLAVIPVFMASFAVYGLYRGISRRISKSVFSDLRNILHAVLIGGLICAAAAYIAAKHFRLEGVSGDRVTTMCVAALVAVPLFRALSYWLLSRALDGSVPVVVVGTGKLAQTVASHLRAHTSVNFIGFVDDNPLGHGDVLGNLDDLPALCREYRVERVVVCFSQTHPERTTEMLKSLAGQVGVSIVPRYYELITSRSHIEDLSGLPMLGITPASLSAGSRLLKRTFDIVMSSIILLLIAPLIAVLAVMIKVTSPGSVFFRQERTGKNLQPFSMLKFRTMYSDAEEKRSELAHLNEADGPLFKVQNDPELPDQADSCVGQASMKSLIDQRLERRHVVGRTSALRSG